MMAFVEAWVVSAKEWMASQGASKMKEWMAWA